ncbi:protein sidekick-2-like [Schistocerca nitens]|uniref:protein sidekick-2-like n=1 Tax=Schistocerca nitens TaxID=7011 RepID=UPI0021198AC1|nr:protein sidekick-2-like [Schistocerca nitens]
MLLRTLGARLPWSVCWALVCLHIYKVGSEEDVSSTRLIPESTVATSTVLAPAHQHGLYTGPFFDTSMPTNITAQLGTHAYLPCRIKQLGNKSVSWIRRRDAHILTVDRYTFIADERFQAFLVEATSTWTLQVKYVQARDAGEYECQVSAAPKMSHFVTLHVVVPRVQILGGPELYVKAGSTVALRCEISRALEEPAYILWFHESRRVLAYQDMHVERVAPDATVGSLLIRRATRRLHSGNYSCRPSNLDPAFVFLHVLDGEHPAAMQRDKNSAGGVQPPQGLRRVVGQALLLGALATALAAPALP